MTSTVRRAAAAAVAVATLLVVASFRPLRPVLPPTPEAPTEVERIYAPFDTLETDLDDYRWPLPDGFLTTSVFGDFRSTHFHGGIDVSTQGREGIPVRAMRSGWVSLIRHSPHGYGNVVEVTYGDRFSTWHAHLQGFAPQLDSLVRPLLRARGGVVAEVKPDPGAVPVAAQEIIAFTGSTGAGGPHHHFEIRDAHGNPVDPMLVPAFRDRVADAIAPTFEELGIIPLTAGTLVQGGLRPAYVRPSRRGRAATIDQRLRVTGDVGLTVRVRDAVGPRRFTNRNVALDVFVDGVSVYTSKAARLPSGDSKQIALHYDWTARTSGHPYHQKLFVEEGNRLPFYARAPYGAGVLRSSDFAEGSHTLEVVARDLNGNVSRLRADIIFNHPPGIRVEHSGRQLLVTPTSTVGIDRILVGTSTDGARFTPWKTFTPHELAVAGEGWSMPAPEGAPYLRIAAVNRFGTSSDPVWVAPATARSGELNVSLEVVRTMAIVTMRSADPMPSPPRVRIVAEGIVPEPPVHSVTSRHAVTSFPLHPELGRSITVEAIVEGPRGAVVRGSGQLDLAPITPDLGGIAELPDRSFHLHFGPRGVLSDTYVQLEQSRDGVRATPADRVLDEGATVEMDVPSDLIARKAGLFVFNGGDDQLLDWRPAFGERRLSGSVSRFLGTFRILEDETAPRFDRAYLAYRAGTLHLELRIRDDRSGLSTSSIRVTVDGRPIPGSFDSDRRRLTVRERLELPTGRHRVEVRATDRMENERTWVGTVVVR